MTGRCGEDVQPKQLVRCGWAYQEPWWGEDHEWHLTRSKPNDRHGRRIRPVYLGPENGPYIWPDFAEVSGSDAR